MEEMNPDFDKILEILSDISLILHKSACYPILRDIREILDNFEFIKFSLENYSSYADELERYVLFLFAFKIMKMGECDMKEICEAQAESTRSCESEDKWEKIKSFASQKVNSKWMGESIKYINENYINIFSDKLPREIYLNRATLDFVKEKRKDINKSVLTWLAKNKPFYLINNFSDFKNVLYKNPKIIEVMLHEISLSSESSQFNKVIHILERAQKDSTKQIIDAYINKLVEEAMNENLEDVYPNITTLCQYLKRTQKSKVKCICQRMVTANEYSKELAHRGCKVTIDGKIDFSKWTRNSFPSRLLSLTHIYKNDSDHKLISYLSIYTGIQLEDIVETNIQGNKSYSESQKLYLDFLTKSQVLVFQEILLQENNFFIWKNDVIRAFESLSKSLSSEELKQFIDMLLVNLQNVVKDSKNEIEPVLAYNCNMLGSALIEALIRNAYAIETQSKNNGDVTLSDLLSGKNECTQKIFTDLHVKALSYFLMQNFPGDSEDLGLNIRNSLAHLHNVSKDLLSRYGVAEVMWLFTDVLNSIYLFHCENQTPS